MKADVVSTQEISSRGRQEGAQCGCREGGNGKSGRCRVWLHRGWKQLRGRQEGVQCGCIGWKWLRERSGTNPLSVNLCGTGFGCSPVPDMETEDKGGISSLNKPGLQTGSPELPLVYYALILKHIMAHTGNTKF